MTGRAVLRQFLIAFLGTTAVVFVILQTDVVQHVSYMIEKGRLKALSEAVPDEEFIASLNQPNRMVAALVTPAVVQITAIREVTLDPAPDVAARLEGADAGLDFEAFHPWAQRDSGDGIDQSPPSFEMQGLGSGFIFDAEKGYVLTNYHVTERADRIIVHLADGRRYNARIVGADAATDLTVLAIPADRLHQVEFGDSRLLAVGDEVFAIGNPFGLQGTFSRGIISALRRSPVAIHNVTYTGFIQTDAVINPGNSGGPLVNRRGQVIGVNTAIVTDSGRFDGVGFAIPSSRVVGLIPQLIQGRKIVRGFLGVSTVNIRDDRETAEGLGWFEDYGVIVKYVGEGSPAEAAGLQFDDILVEIDGHRIEGVSDLMDFVALMEPGTVTTLGFWRGGELLSPEVRLARRPDGL